MIDATILRKHLSFDPISGEFRWQTKGKGRLVGELAGCESDTGAGRRYVKIRVERRLYLAHRLAWLWVHGEWPSAQIDHVDGNGLNNRIANLRLSDQTQNLGNAAIRNCNTSGFKGVTQRGAKWIAQIHYKGENCYLGIFDDARSAAIAYDKAAINRFGNFSRNNNALGLL